MSREKSEEQNVFKQLFMKSGEYIKANWQILFLFVVTFLLCTTMAFFKTSASNSIVSFDINEYQVGQIADITIVANKNLPATDVNPAVEKGEKVTHKGFPITEEQYRKMDNMAHSKSYFDARAFANAIIFLVLIGLLCFFLYNPFCIGKKVKFKELLLEASLFMLIYFATAFGGPLVPFGSAYAITILIPATLSVALIAILFGHVDSVFFSFIQAFAVLGASGYQIIPFLYVLASSLACVRITRHIGKRMDLVIAAIVQAFVNCIILAVFMVIFNESFRDSATIYVGVAINGFISGILTLGFLTPLEHLFNTASIFRLMDLSDLNTSKVMQLLMINANGTYQHTMMVAQLAEAASRAIGANPLIARVASYYHDVGKMDRPEYFTENNAPGTENKHKDINPSLSVTIIKDHIKRSVDMAHDLHLPDQVVDIISEHHGNQVIAWFYDKAKQIDPNATAADYSYPGTPPSTKESGIVMLADTVEAACHSLDKPTAQRLDKFILGLINSKYDNHQLDNCDLTFKDLDRIRQVFVQILAGYYHTRIKYPGQKDMDDDDDLGNGTLSGENVSGDATVNLERSSRTILNEGNGRSKDPTIMREGGSRNKDSTIIRESSSKTRDGTISKEKSGKESSIIREGGAKKSAPSEKNNAKKGKK